MTPPRLVGVVLTGGASRRMGVDKASLPFDGVPMAVRVARALREAGCGTIEAQGGHRRHLEPLGLDVVADVAPGGGPVPAIAAALERHRDADVVVAACDLPWLDAVTVASVVDMGREHEVACAVATVAGERQLVAWFGADRDPASTGRAASDVGSFNGLVGALGALDVEVEPRTVRNINTPGDFDLPG